MKSMKTVVLVLMAIFVLATLSTQNAQAADVWLYHAKVTQVGPGGGAGIVYIRLTDTTASPPIDNVWFKASDVIKKEMLATALTAISLDKEVMALVTDTANYSTIKNLYLDNR